MSTTHCERNIPAEEPRTGTVLTTALGGRRRWAALLVLLFAQFVLAIDLTIMDIALPGISTQLHPSSEQQLWIVDVYSLVLAGLLVAASSLSDRIGRKRTFLSGALVFCIGSALVLAARSAPGVIGVRAVMGVAAALIMPTTISAVRNIFLDAAERTVAVAAWSIVGGAGMAVGPVLGGFLVERFSWHSAFLVNIPLMGLVLVAGIAVLPEIKVVKKGPWDPAAAVLSLLGMVLTVWALKRIAAGDEAPAPRLLLTLALALSAGIALLALFVRRCLRAAEPLLEVRLFADRTFTGGILAAFGSMFALASMLFLLSQWMQLVNGYSPLRSGVLLLPAVLSGILSGATAPALARLLGARRVMADGIAVAGLALLLLFLLRGALGYPLVAVVMALVGLGMGSLAVGSAALMGATPPEKASSGAAFEEIAYDLGNVLGVAVLGSIASIAYRLGLDADSLAEAGVDAGLAAQASQSYAAAVSIAREHGLDELASRATASFNGSVVLTSAVGGLIMVIVAVLVHRLVPRGLDLQSDE